MSVTNSPASAILRGRRLSSRRPSGRRASSSCDCCPSREPDEWTTWTVWGRSAMERGSQVGGWKTKFKRRLRVFGANLQVAPTRGLEDASTFVLRGCAGWAGRTRARALGSSPEPIEYRASIECRYFGDVRAGSGRGKSDGVAPTPASFRRGRTKKAVWREYTLSALRVLGRTWVCLRSRGSPSSSKSSPPPFSFHSDAIEHGPDARDDSRGRLPPRGTDRRKLESSFQTKDAKQWPKKN
jgi:hypothetical protein